MGIRFSHVTERAQPLPPVPGNVLSMDMRFLCPKCGGKVRIGLRSAGHKVVCVRCSEPILVPALPECWHRSPGPQPSVGPPLGGAPLSALRRTAGSAYPPGVLSIDVRFACSACGQKLVVDVQAAGRAVRCTHCARAVRVPPLHPPSESLSPPARETPATAAPPPDPGTVALTDEEIAFMTKTG